MLRAGKRTASLAHTFALLGAPIDVDVEQSANKDVVSSESETCEEWCKEDVQDAIAYSRQQRPLPSDTQHGSTSAFRSVASFRNLEYTDGRGKYDRNRATVRKRLSLAQLAWEHHAAIQRMDLRICSQSCPFGGRCFNALSANDLLACHNESFGTSLTWDEQKSTPILKQSTGETQKKWRQVMNSIFQFNGEGKLTSASNFTVANVRVCAECMRKSYSIPSSTWNKNIAIGRSTPRAFEMHEAQTDLERSERRDRTADQRQLTKFSVALNWWLDWLSWCVPLVVESPHDGREKPSRPMA